MTEPKRATWREFVDALACDRRYEKHSSKLRRASCDVNSRRDAELVCFWLLGMGEFLAAKEIEDWLAALQLKGIEFPVDPPSVAQVLESVATEIASAGERFCADLSGDEARRLKLAFGCAAAIVRAKAKEVA